ncbi:uncharacterized protein LOC108101141 [Drosophila ficusphila]|uniref:uncharacterized protein LOC108101141 n=1 Tax=Drosophila ficusphila TaxID=30025 RepID=UPI001C896E0B|nr:uncharacterized protein LOC108101141 [Drosophila ficusphila]
MTAKKTTFDMMNLGYPINSDPYEVESQSSVSPKERAQTVLSHKELRYKLYKEAQNMMPDFLRDPSSSSDDSDDIEIPETPYERARRLTFARRRRLHYNEFATVELARRLIHDEFNTSDTSLRSEYDGLLPEAVEAECPPCEEQSKESIAFIQYNRPTITSHMSDDSMPKEDPEPGFHPTHHCYSKLISTFAIPPVVEISLPEFGTSTICCTNCTDTNCTTTNFATICEGRRTRRTGRTRS